MRSIIDFISIQFVATTNRSRGRVENNHIIAKVIISFEREDVSNN